MDLPACVRGDEQRIRRVLVNLVGNAVKYTDSGHITLRARVVKRGPGVVDVEYRVSDTGVGIPDAMLERVFERFVRLNTPGRAYVPGSGLGLGICRALALLMRGSLWVHSRLNEGSDFFLQLPHALAQRAPAAPPTPSTLSVLPAEDPPRNVATRETTRILITDDSRDQRALLRHYLRPRPNTELFFAENGLEALELIGQHRFSLLLLDMMMPVMDGVTAAKAIREREQDGDHLPIVAMTAFDLESVGPRFLGAGCDAILAKPYQLVDLMTVVEAHIRHS
jgi:CheY-like chemotaxis protein